MKNLKKLCGFTLSELLIAVGIIGIISAMSVPALVENIHKKTFATDLKNFTGQIEHLANTQLATRGTKDLKLTDFSSVNKLFSDKNFMAVKKCSSAEAKQYCWDNKSSYKTLSGNSENIASSADSLILKNGTVFSYSNIESDVYELKDSVVTKTTKTIGRFCVDLNGANVKPNKIGRDYFCFYIDELGRNVGSKNLGTISANSSISSCKGNSATAEICYDAVYQSGWNIDY